MKHKLPALAALLLTALFAWTACTKPTLFGSELLQGDAADYAFMDSLSVRFTVQYEDSTITSDRASTSPYFLCGELDDPYFGKSSSDIFTLMQLSTFDPGFDLARHKLDSVVLYLRMIPAGVYGDTAQLQTLRVFRLDDPLSPSANYYSSQSFPATSPEIGMTSFYPKPNKIDSLFSASSKAAYVRVRLDDALGQELLGMDSATLVNDSAFYNKIRGLKIVTSANTSPGAMLAFNLNDEVYSRVRLFYTQDDTLPKIYDYFFSGVNKFTHFANDYMGRDAVKNINKINEDFLYVQGMNGLRLKVEIPYADQLDRIAVNEADLVLTVATRPNDFPALKAANQLIFTIRSDTNFIFTPDVTYSLGPTLSGGFSAFGGFPAQVSDNGTTIQQYRLALSDYLQQIVDDTSGDPEKKTLYINVYPQNRSAMRAIFYGPDPGNPYPAKLELKYTHLQ